jgi:hypothetical protein
MTEYALSIRQPWAWLIAAKLKDVENRTWKTPFRGWFYIHAGKKLDSEITVLDLEMGYGLHPAYYHDWSRHNKLGGIIGRARLVDCVESSPSKWFHGPYGFVIRDAELIDFIPYPGRLGFFPVQL